MTNMNAKQTTTEKPAPKGQTLKGTVVSNKMKDTVVVLVERYVKVPKYQKYVVRRKKYMAHDAGNTKQMGDKVEIIGSKPFSKHKKFIVVA